MSAPEYQDEDEDVNPIEQLIARVPFTLVGYCVAGGHFVVLLSGEDAVCPMGCND